jgi:hypothetical protein
LAPAFAKGLKPGYEFTHASPAEQDCNLEAEVQPASAQVRMLVVFEQL